MTGSLNITVENRKRLLAEVPPFRPVALKLLKLVQGSTHSLAEIVSLLRTDAVLTGEVLRLANSPLFSCRSEVKNVLQAVALLGLDRINAMILTTAMRSLVDRRNERFTHSCWRHSLATALVCQRLSKTVALGAERCYVAG